MESSDEYTESPATHSAKSPVKKEAKQQDAYAYFVNKERAAKGEAPVQDDQSDLSDSEEAKQSGRAEDPGIAKIKADMARRKAEATVKKKEPEEVDPGISSESYTESPVSAAAKKPSPEVKKASPPAQAAKKQDAYDYFLKKDQAARGVAPVEDEDDSDFDDTEESKEMVEDPAIAKMKAEAAKRKEATLAPKVSPHKKAAPEPEEIRMASSPSSPVSESYAEDDIPDMEDDDLELSQTMARRKTLETKTIESSPAPPNKLIKPMPITQAKKEVVKSESDPEEEINFDGMSDAPIEESVADESDINQSREEKPVEQSKGQSPSTGKDLLFSGTNNMEFEHVEVKDPAREKADRDIENELAGIAPKFGATGTKKAPAEIPAKRSRALLKDTAKTATRPATAKPKAAVNQRTGPVKATPASRPATAAPNRAQAGTKPNATAKERTTSKARPAAPPSAEAVASAKRAASRIREAKEAQRTYEAAKVSPPKKRVDPAKVKEKIVAADRKKKEDLIQSITKLKNFKMPPSKPKFGEGKNEMDLDDQIQGDILDDWEKQLDVGNFGTKAIEADRQKEMKKKQEAAKQKEVATKAKEDTKEAVAKKRSGSKAKGDQKAAAPQKKVAKKVESVQKENMSANKPEEEEEEEEEQEQEDMFKQESEEEEGDQNMPPPAFSAAKKSVKKQSVQASEMEEDEDDDALFKVEDVESEGDQNMPGQTAKVKESTMFEVNDMSMDGTMFERGDEEDEGDQKIPTAPPVAKKAQAGLKVPGAKVQEAEMEMESFQSIHDAMHSQTSSAQAASARSSAAASNKSKAKSQASASKAKPSTKKVSQASKQLTKLESGFGGMPANKEADLKASQRQASALAKEKMQALQHAKMLKQKEEMDKIKRLNMGATEFMKQQKKEQQKGKLNNRIQDFTINEQQGPTVNMAATKAVPVDASMVHDAEGLADQLKDLMKDYKTLVDDTKQAEKNKYDASAANRRAKKGLDAVLQERKLILKNGELSKQEEPEALIDLSGIDTQKLLADAQAAVNKVNPLDPIINKFAELGYDTESAFDMLDDNGDGVLTIKEIQDGMAFHKIELTPEQWDEFLKIIDANSDGVLTLDEWQAILEPRVNAQSHYMEIMGAVNISDPLVLQERALDLQYRSRQLEQELKVLRQSNQQANKLKQKQKELSKRILDAEKDDADAVEQQKKAEKELEEQMRSELLQKDQVQQQHYAYQRQKEQLEAEYAMRLEQIQDNMNMLDKKHFDLTQFNIFSKQEKETMKNQLFREEVRFQSCVEANDKLDKEIEEVLGKAVNMNDLQLLNKLDLETLNQIKTDKSQRLNEIAENLAAHKIQAVHKGKMARRDVEELRKNKHSKDCKNKDCAHQEMHSEQLAATQIMQRAFRKKRDREGYLSELEAQYSKKSISAKDLKDLDAKKKAAALKIFKAWKKKKDMKTFSFYSAVRVQSAKETGKSSGVVHIKDKRKCGMCKENLAIRFCVHCTDENLKHFCIDCFKSYHSRGARKRHDRKRIVYEGQDFDANKSIVSSPSKFDPNASLNSNNSSPNRTMKSDQDQQSKMNTSEMHQDDAQGN